MTFYDRVSPTNASQFFTDTSISSSGVFGISGRDRRVVLSLMVLSPGPVHDGTQERPRLTRMTEASHNAVLFQTFGTKVPSVKSAIT